MQFDQTDVIIIGAGPAGSLAAARLLKQGVRVTIVERSAFPRFIIGESLLPHCMDLLDEAGLLTRVEEENFQIKKGALFLKGHERSGFAFSEQFTEGWDYTYQVPRAQFDQVLADTAAGMGAVLHFEHSVESVSIDDDAVRVTVRDPEGTQQTLQGQYVLDASGNGRVLARSLDLEKPSSFPPRSSIFTHVQGDRRLESDAEEKIWICVHPDGPWIWLIPFSDGTTSVGWVGDARHLESYPDDPEARLFNALNDEPNTADRLQHASVMFEPKQVTAFSCAVKTMSGNRFALLGNAAEFLDPVFSSGVTLALECAHRASSLVIRELQGERVDWAEDYDGYIQRGVDTFRTYVKAWYDGTFQEIIFGAGENPKIKKQICSVLAGYVWDTSNPYVQQHERALPLLARIFQQPSSAIANDANP